MIPIAKPYLGPEEHAAVADVLTSGMLATGPRVHAFERAFADYCGAQDAIACSSGTSGLCMAVAALGLPAGSKILTTPFSFIATANCILYAGHQPVFADVDPETFCLTPAGIAAALAQDPDIRAIILVHLYGQACDTRTIVEMARARGIFVIEDCAQAHGATDGAETVGSIGDLGVFSFYPTKNMMTGEGGMITGNDPALVEQCRLFGNHGAPQRYHHTSLGFNYRMTSIAAAIGLCQLERLPAWNARRRRNAAALTAGLRGLPGVQPPVERPGCIHVYHQYVLKLADRPQLQARLEAAGVGTAIHYPTLIVDQPYYRSLGFSGDAYPVAQALTGQVLSLPVHPAVTDADVATIVQAVRDGIAVGV